MTMIMRFLRDVTIVTFSLLTDQNTIDMGIKNISTGGLYPNKATLERYNLRPQGNKWERY